MNSDQRNFLRDQQNYGAGHDTLARMDRAQRMIRRAAVLVLIAGVLVLAAAAILIARFA